MLEYKGYVGHAEYDAEAHVFHGEVLDTPDVITFESDEGFEPLTLGECCDRVLVSMPANRAYQRHVT